MEGMRKAGPEATESDLERSAPEGPGRSESKRTTGDICDWPWPQTSPPELCQSVLKSIESSSGTSSSCRRGDLLSRGCLPRRCFSLECEVP